MPAILFLEPKGPNFEVMRSAKERGFEILALYSDEGLFKNVSEPYKSAHACIDYSQKIKSWAQEEELETLYSELDQKYKLAGIYFGTECCAKIGSLWRERLQLPSLAPSTVDKLILDKYHLRQKLVSLGLSQIQVELVPNNFNTPWPFKGAAYLKPRKGMASVYVFRCENWNDVKKSLAKVQPEDLPPWAANYVSVHDFFLEEEFQGELLSAESLATAGDIQILGLLSRILFSQNPIVEMGSCFPYTRPDENKIKDFVKAVHAALEFSNGPSHVELMVGENGHLEIIDFNPRFVGADVMQSINHAFETKIQEQLLNYTLGEKVELPSQIKKYCCLQYFLAPKSETFESLDFPSHEKVVFKTQFIPEGTPLKGSKEQLDYLGCYLVTGSDMHEALSLSGKLRGQVLINKQIPVLF